MDILGQLIRSHDTIARFIRRAFQSLHDVVSEDAVAAAPVLTLERPFAVAAGGE